MGYIQEINFPDLRTFSLRRYFFMYVIYDELAGNIKLVEEFFDEIIFEVTVYAKCEVAVMIDFLLLYANITTLS